MTEPLPDLWRDLLTFSRATLEAVTHSSILPAPPAGGELDRPAAVFVTLRAGEDLRGCVGDISFSTPLGAAVGAMTRAAATTDPRFPPISPNELPRITIEISRLTPFVRAEPPDIVPGRHGVMLRKGKRTGLLLPQVATEFECDAIGFLELAYRKAGLLFTGAHDPSVNLEIFEAEVFEE